MEVPAIEAPLPRASFAEPDRAPKLMPAIVIGISSWSGFLANLVPRVTLVEHFSL